MTDKQRERLITDLSKAAAVLKLVCGVANNAAWQVVLHAYSYISGRQIDPTDPDGERRVPAHPRFRHEVKRQFRRAIDEWHDYEARLIYATEYRMFHLDDMTEAVRRRYGDITDRQYYEFWSSVGGPAFSKTMPLITSLWNKYRLSLINHKVDNADHVAWVMTALAAIELADQLYFKAIEECRKGYNLPRQLLTTVFHQFRLTRMKSAWHQAMLMMAPDTVFDLEYVEKRNIEVGLMQLCDAWSNPKLMYESTMDSVEDYDEVFATRGFQQKSLRELADIRDKTEEAIMNNNEHDKQ